MCCIFTCCGWMIDLVQRLWTFTMSCCISSAVCCVMLTSSMSGIALGYNYSLAEYIDLKETNVSIYLKRGVFDDEIADDVDWRRSGHLPVAGHIGTDNLMTGAPAEEDSTPLRSGRRLDDSVFEADDAHKYEGSLMKLTAKPAFHSTTRPHVTDDLEMSDAMSKYAQGSLDQMKAVQSLIDSRRAMGTSGTIASPLATYNVNDRNLAYLPMYANPNIADNRRAMEPDGSLVVPQLSPARYAVPNPNIGSKENWLIPRRPDLFIRKYMPDYFALSPTYPPPITLQKGLKVPPSTREDVAQAPVVFVTRTIGTTKKKSLLAKLAKDAESLNDNFLMDLDTASKNEFKKVLKPGKSSEEEYEDEIKGLPVRKRRSIKAKTLAGNAIKYTEWNITNVQKENDTNKSTSYIFSTGDTKINYFPNSIKEATSTQTIDAEIPNMLENNYTNTKNQSSDNESNKSQVDIQTLGVESSTNQQTILNEKLKSNPEHTVETNTEQIHDNKHGNTLLGRIIKTMEAKISSVIVETTQKTTHVPAKKIKIQTGRKSFESKIVSSKYLPNTKPTRLFDAKQKRFSNAEILDSISINLNEAGLLRNPASSTFVKLLQSTLT